MKNLKVAKKILWMKIIKNRFTGRVFLTQQYYVKKVLKHFSMTDAKLVYTPLAAHFKLSHSYLHNQRKINGKWLKFPPLVQLEVLLVLLVVICPAL